MKRIIPVPNGWHLFGKTICEVVGMYEYDFLPCPFCGSERIDVKSRYSSNTERYFWFAKCSMCKAQTGAFDGSGAAVDAWNTRAGGVNVAKQDH